MKTSSPRQLAFNISFLIASIILVLLYLNYRFELTENRLWIFSTVFLVFVVTFIILFSSLNSFIFKKINPIYKTIKNINLGEKELRKKIGSGDVITQVKNDVVAWAKTKTQEIDELKKLEQYRKEFLGNVSHELKTPIFNIQGYVLTLLDGGLEDQKINRKYLERTEKSINRMISIVQDLESISRLESGELKLHMKRFNIVDLFSEVFELQEMMARERSIKMEFEQPLDKNLFVYADRDRIMEVANNLLVNSIKYGKQNGKTTVSFLEMGENLLIDVTDTGIGIAEGEIRRIFERFYRTDKSRSRDMGGTGLGLAIVKHIIEAHNQTINVRSKLGEGSSFAFTLKRVK